MGRSAEHTREFDENDRYAEEADPGASMRSSPVKFGRIRTWWSRVQWRLLLERDRTSGRVRLRRLRRRRRVTVEDLYPNAANENQK
jgi:hypothetical protein